jgi:UDP-N-acetylglucosamine 1-carboxyvinyltransferase
MDTLVLAAGPDSSIGVGSLPRAVPDRQGFMDRIRLVGGNALKGEIPISGAKNAALPLMIASLAHRRDPLTLDQRAAARATSSPARAHPRRITASTSLDRMASRQRPGRHDVGQTHAPVQAARHRRHHGALRPRLEDAGELLGHRPAAGPHATRRACRCRAAAPSARARSTSSCSGPEGAGRRDRHRRRLRRGAGAEGRAGRSRHVSFPKVSVGATHTLMMAATLAKRRPRCIDNVAHASRRSATSPKCLNADGRAHFEGIGTRTLIHVEGVERLARRRGRPRAPRPHRDRHLRHGHGHRPAATCCCAARGASI